MSTSTESSASLAAATEVPPPVRIAQLLHGQLVTALLGQVAELGVADLVADGPRPVDELAAATGTHPGALYRALRALAGKGIFTEVGPRVFGLTPLAAALRTDVPGSMRALTRFLCCREMQLSIIGLAHSLRTEQPAFDHEFGTDFWSHLGANPELGELFNDAMGNYARQIHVAAVEAYDLSGVRRLVDVGGGHGYLVATILQRYPQMSAVIFDLPEVVAGAMPVLAEAGVSDRVELVGGDFFASVPPGGDAYVLAHVLHDWNNAQATAILANVRRAMDPAGQVVVVDAVIPPGDVQHPGKLLDISMLMLATGRERTEEEFGALFQAAGLRHASTWATASPTCVTVAVPD